MLLFATFGYFDHFWLLLTFLNFGPLDNNFKSFKRGSIHDIRDFWCCNHCFWKILCLVLKIHFWNIIHIIFGWLLVFKRICIIQGIFIFTGAIMLFGCFPFPIVCYRFCACKWTAKANIRNVMPEGVSLPHSSWFQTEGEKRCCSTNKELFEH